MLNPTILRQEYIITRYTASGLETNVFKTKADAIAHIN